MSTKQRFSVRFIGEELSHLAVMLAKRAGSGFTLSVQQKTRSPGDLFYLENYGKRKQFKLNLIQPALWPTITYSVKLDL